MEKKRESNQTLRNKEVTTEVEGATGFPESKRFQAKKINSDDKIEINRKTIKITLHDTVMTVV